jgi:uncharacterized protein DUF7010
MTIQLQKPQTTSASGSASLDELKLEIIRSSRRGYPILLAGALFFTALAVLPALVPLQTARLLWVLGLVIIFPLGILIGRLLGIEVITRHNPLGTLGGLIAGTQIFYLPVFMAVYQFKPELLPLTIGLLGGAHFLPYAWLYNSRAYMFTAFAMGVAAFVLGGLFMSSALRLVPIALALIYIIATVWLLAENRAMPSRASDLAGAR